MKGITIMEKTNRIRIHVDCDEVTDTYTRLKTLKRAIPTIQVKVRLWL